MHQFRLFKRGASGRFYLEEIKTRKQVSLKTSSKEEAQRLLGIYNERHQNPALNRRLAAAYLACSDPEMASRTWQDVMDCYAKNGQTATVRRKHYAIRDKAFDSIRSKKLVETISDDFLKVLNRGSVSTNTFLRKIHNYALDMDWLLKVVLPKKHWPKFHHKKRRAITHEEHLSIIERELNEERRLFYKFLWETGASQGDAALLTSASIDWKQNILIIYRKKLENRDQPPSKVRIGTRLAEILNQLPKSGLLFPYLAKVRSGDRSTEFKQRCDGLGIHGISLHSYRYAWAQRAKSCGYPERMAMSNLGHGCKAVHRSYAENADTICPSLEEWEEDASKKIISLKDFSSQKIA